MNFRFSFFGLCLATVAVAVLCTQTNAQNLGEAPLVKDVTPQQTLPKDGVFDIRGISLGMTIKEIESAYKAVDPAGRIQPENINYSLKDNRGNSAGFKYTQSLQLGFGDDKSSESYIAVFSTGLAGGRAVFLSRALRYNNDANMGSLSALLDGLFKKYGQPSYEERNDGLLSFSWVWFQGKRISFPDGDPRRFRRSLGGKGTPDYCMGKASYGWKYSFRQNREDPAPGCTTIIDVKIFTGKAKDLVQSFTIDMVDKTGALTAATVSDKWIMDEIERKANSQVPREGPKL